MTETLPARVKRRIRTLYKNGRFTQTEVAEAAGVVPSAIGPYMNGSREFSLGLLEAVAQIAKIPVAELVVPDGERMRQLSPEEDQLLGWLRAWPPSVRRSLSDFVTFFAQESDEDQQTRGMMELWRRARPREKLRILGLASLEVEKVLYGDTQAALDRLMLAEDRASRDRRQQP